MMVIVVSFLLSMLMLVEDDLKREEREGKKGNKKQKKRKGPLLIKVRAFFSMVFYSSPFFHIINSRVHIMFGFNS